MMEFNEGLIIIKTEHWVGCVIEHLSSTRTQKEGRIITLTESSHLLSNFVSIIIKINST